MNKTNDITLQEIAKILKAERSSMLRYASYRLGDKDDAEDVLQDVFLKLHSRLSAPEELHIQDLRSYLFRSLSNICTKWLSQTSRLKTVPIDTIVEQTGTTTDDKNEDDYKRIVQLLAKIPEEQAEVIRLRIYGNNSFAEVADILSLPLPTVKSRFLYGLEKIRKSMKQH